MPATVIAERIGWERSIGALRDRVAEVRPLFVPPDPCQRTSYDPGELAQFDLWQPEVEIPLGSDPADTCWVLLGVCGFSGFTDAWMVPSRAAHDVLSGMPQVFGQFGGIPRTAVWDQEGCIGAWRHGCQQLSRECQAFRGALGWACGCARRMTLRPRGSSSAATVISRRASCPGGVSARSTTSPPAGQLATTGEQPRPRHHPGRPSEAILEDGGAMLAFRPVLSDPSWRFTTRVPRDHHVRVGTNDYSVNPRYVGRRVEVRVTLDEVVVTCEGTEVARHRRCLAEHRSLLAPEHSRPLRAMRAEAAVVSAFLAAVEERDLTDHDRALRVA